MKKYKVIDILTLADKTYSLYFDKEDKERQVRIFSR